MPIIKSAKKRVRVSAKANSRNARTKRSMRESLKAFTKAVASGSAKEISEAQKVAVSAIDKAVKKAVIHKNKAARKKAQVSAQAKASGAKPSSAAPKKPAAPRPTAKSPAKKPVAKKASPKKAAAKK